MYEDNHEWDREHEDALDDVAESEVDEVAEGLVLVQPVAEYDVNHDAVGESADGHYHGVEEHEQRVEGDERVSQLGLSEVDAAVVLGTVVEIVDHVLQKLVRKVFRLV